MIKYKKIIILISILFINLSCVEKKSYSGKLTDLNIRYDILTNKKQIISNLGQPNFIDPIENKYYYFFEKKVKKHFFNTKIETRRMIVYNFDENENVIYFKQYNLDQEQQINFINERTQNNLVERGMLEKIFGGIGKNTITDTSQ